MKQFFYGVGDERRGPVTEPALLNLFRLRTVTAETLLWSDGMPDWRALGEVFPHWLSETGSAAAVVASESENAHCMVTGRLLPKTDMIRFGEVFVSPENRDIYLQRLQQGLSGRLDDLSPATVWQRFAGSFIDWLVVGVPLVAIGVIMKVINDTAVDASEDPGSTSELDAGVGSIAEILPAAMILFASAAYEITMTATRGATLGKMVVQTCVVDAQGQTPGWGRASGRWALKTLLSFTPGVGGIYALASVIMALVDQARLASYAPVVGGIYSLVSVIMALVDQPWRRAIHDRGAITRVVQRRCSL